MTPTELEDKRTEYRHHANKLLEAHAAARRAGDRDLAESLAFAAERLAADAEHPLLCVILDEPLEAAG